MGKRSSAVLWVLLAASLPLSAQSATPNPKNADTAVTTSEHSLPDAPTATVKRKVMDWKYTAVTGALFAASASNAETLVRCDNCTYIPLSMHRRGVTYGVGLPIDIAVSYFGYRLKKQGHRWWYVPSVALTAANAYLSYHWANSKQ